MEQSPSWDAVSHSDSQEFPGLLWNPKVHYRVHMRPPLFPVLSQINPVRIFLNYFPTTHLVLSSHLHLGLPCCLFFSGFPTKSFYAFPIFHLSHACYMSCPFNTRWCDHPKNTKLFIVQSSPACRHILLFRYI